MMLRHQGTTMFVFSQAILAIYLLPALLKQAAAESDMDFKVSCPPQDITLSMAGLQSGNRLLGAWQKVYSSKYCPGFNITFESNSWDSAAARVCDSSLIDNPVDIASMGGSFFQPQATTSDGWTFQCMRSKLERETALLLVAHKGLTIGISKEGAAAQCIELLGGGLTIDQLHWIYSASSSEVLIANGWDPSSVPFLDDDDTTYLWSEIHENCTATEIVLAAEEAGTGRDDAMEYMFDHVLRSRGEVMRDYFSANSAEELNGYLHANSAAISFFHLYGTLSKEFQARDLLGVGIKNDRGDVIMPFATSFDDETYPFLKKITIGLVNTPVSLESTRPFLDFGFSSEGTEILKQLGYWPMEQWRKLTMYTRYGSDQGLGLSEIEKHCGDSTTSETSLTIAGGNTVLPVVRLWSEFYKLACPLRINLEGGRSSTGAQRICATSESGDAIDLGMMSRDFDLVTEAAPRSRNDFVYDCLIDDEDEPRSAIQVEIALDGIAIILAVGSHGEKCVRLLGGLTMDQLRWMFSNYSDMELEQSGWDPSSLSNNDFDSTTHLWNELDNRCADEEIKLVGDFVGEGTYTGFLELVLKDFAKGEHVALNRPIPYYEAYGGDVLQYLFENEAASSFAGYNFFFLHQETFWAVPLATEAGAPFVRPSEDSIASGSYPLSRSMFVNVRDEVDILRKVIPFLEFGYAHPDLIRSTGYAPIDEERVEEMLRRLNNGPYTFDEDEEEIEEQSHVGLIMGVIVSVGVVVALIIVAIKYCRQ